MTEESQVYATTQRHSKLFQHPGEWLWVGGGKTDAELCWPLKNRTGEWVGGSRERERNLTCPSSPHLGSSCCCSSAGLGCCCWWTGSSVGSLVPYLHLSSLPPPSLGAGLYFPWQSLPFHPLLPISDTRNWAWGCTCSVPMTGLCRTVPVVPKTLGVGRGYTRTSLKLVSGAGVSLPTTLHFLPQTWATLLWGFVSVKSEWHWSTFSLALNCLPCSVAGIRCR